MPTTTTGLDRLVTAMVPSLSKSLAEQFNVFRVMHHGTHEKQLSNVFAWLLDVEGTHELGDTFQRLFVDRVNRGLPEEAREPTTDYRVLQEVDTAGPDGAGRDIADIVLSSPGASIVVENFESSDGHGHDYERYLTYGTTGGRQSVVVLLCARWEVHRQTSGWERAVVVTYEDLLGDLKTRVDGDSAWNRAHPRQNFFINELIEHFKEGPEVVSTEDQIKFIQAMCETGESARYGHRPHEQSAQAFAEVVAQHAKHQFVEGRRTLAQVKKTLKGYAERVLMGQLNEALENGRIDWVQTKFVGQWEWCVTLGGSAPTSHLVFGPTAVAENNQLPEPLVDLDYSKIFVYRDSVLIETGVGMGEVLTGLAQDDTRLRDSVLAAMSAA